MHLADAFIQSDLQCIQAINFLYIYFTVSVVRQRNEYEKVTVTRPIKTITSSPFQDINLHKNPDNRAGV